MIRPATIEDLPSLVEIETEVFPLDRISRRSFRHLLTRANAVSLVDEEEHGLCGYVTVLFRHGSPIARLYSIAVHPRCRGCGRGDALLAAAERASRERRCACLRLEVHPGNVLARRFYVRAGYHEFGMFRQFYEDGSDAIRMEKHLACHPEPKSALPGKGSS